MDKQQNPASEDQHFESDVAKLVRRHLSDPNHVITDEEMASLRVGMISQPDGSAQEAAQDVEQHIADPKTDSENGSLPGAQKITPWDVVE